MATEVHVVPVDFSTLPPPSDAIIRAVADWLIAGLEEEAAEENTPKK